MPKTASSLAKTATKPNRQSPPKSAPNTSTKTAKSSRRGGSPPAQMEPASHLIDQRIRDLGGWRGETLARMRALILATSPEIVEEWKWQTPVWSQNGLICTGEAYKQVVKLTFAKGAAVPDPSRLFNSSLTGNTRRAIDIREGETIDARAFRTLVKAAINHNAMTSKTGPITQEPKPVRLLTGGNPQIAKADGDEPVQAYLNALPGWKRDLGHRLDDLIVRAVPKTRKAVKWNSPFYGIDGEGWFLSIHAFTHYLKVTFFRGRLLKPMPPGESKSPEVRTLDIRENDEIDEARFTEWARQAASIPGWKP